MSPDRLSSTTSYIDMRLAEVYLNYAEAVVEMVVDLAIRNWLRTI